ncbi:protein BREAST CANCER SUSCEPTIBILITY 2 homolog B isoform X2 [Oryza sativa Japonica Group]|uniref:protein BREAST CANCER SUSCEPTIBILITY 2 homolog B isoform X2 n=1 Tax=Oryza sativa subsp. japonica TaxID=39947 RepID=UPI00077559E9|nr:protein BREAST CANCER SUSCEPTIBILITY 2 homolog B isoform X2 [Oryza sativa Japonica Group]
MQRRWQVWGKPDGSLVWVPASDGPPPPAAAASEAPLPRPDPQPAATELGEARSGDAIPEGPGAADGCSVPSMADLFNQALDKLVAADGMAEAIEDSGKGAVFCTGLGGSVAVSERAVERAKALVGEVAEEISNERRQPFGDGSNLECGLGESNVSFKGGVHKDSLSPMFQTGSGKMVSLSKGSIQKARAVLEGNAENSSVIAVQSMFHTGLVRPDPVSRSSTDNAMTVLEGQTNPKQGDVADVYDKENFPLFQTGSGKAVSVSVASIQKAKAVLEQNNTENTEDFGRPDQSLIFQTGSRRPVLISERSSSVVKDGGAENIVFQTGLGRPVVVSQTSIQKARTVLDQECAKRSGHGDTNVSTTTFQTETPTSVLMSGGLTMNDRSVTPEGGVSMQGNFLEADGHLPLFQTGLGRSISVSKGSIKRASALLEPRNITKELEDEAHSDDGCATPMFKTGSGRSITASENSRKKAHVVLEGEEPVKNVNNDTGEAIAPMLHAGMQKFAPQNRNSSHKAITLMEQGSSMKEEYIDRGNEPPMFRTGSGKSVLISHSSVQKARAVLEEEGNMKKENHKQLSNVDKYIPIFTSPLKTSYARTVHISSVGVSRAATLLGLEENTLSTQLLGHVGDKLGTKITVERENSEHQFGVASVSGISGGCPISSGPAENQVLMDPHQHFAFSKTTFSDSSEQAIRFSTAGGRTMAISSDALQRAKNLLGESDLEVSPNNLLGHSSASACKENIQNSTGLRKEGEPDLLKSRGNSKTEPAQFSIPAKPDRKHTDSLEYAVPDATLANGNSVRLHAARDFHPINEIPKISKPSSRCSFGTENASDTKDKARRLQMPSGPLIDITNYIDTHSVNTDYLAGEKRRFGGRNSISPFKRPRSSRFIAPININNPSPSGVSKLPIQINPCRTKLSSCYPFQHQRKSCEEYFGGPPCFKYLTEDVTDEVKLMDAKKAEKYKFKTDTGAEEFQKMLLACGASLTYTTKEWVSNHYKWIVWKLASLERCYPTRAAGKFLKVGNVLEELKYRYDREVNNGHRSAIKKILEGNASPSLMMVLCISAIYSCPDLNNSKPEDDRAHTDDDNSENKSLRPAKRNMSTKIELTDGWYSLDASLDLALLEQLEKRKLFIGQKLRIWGASLCGWAGPVSFHEASGTVKLMIHINGTYRARWDETLGLCKHAGVPLAFKCIKASGGRVPRTLVGVTRIYPVMYRERFSDGRFVVRSERMERKALQLYHQRVSKIAEDIQSEHGEHCDNTDDNDEGAKICKMLERAAEPEILMSSMSSEQLLSFSYYQEKQKIVRQNEVAKKVENALKVAGLSSRDVTPFLKVRVTGLISKHSATKSGCREGLITIWNPTEKQKSDLVEGQIYSVTGLLASSYFTEVSYLSGRGSSTAWTPLATAQTTNFEPFFTPRKAVELSHFGEVPLTSEFDIAGVILYVGNVYLLNNQNRQWLFLTDGSKFISGEKYEEQDDCLLAVSFSSKTTGEDSAFFNYALSGHIVGFSNLVKRDKDQMRHVWVAEATESSTYSLSHEIPKKSHLKEAATSAEKWASNSHPMIQHLKERVLQIVGDSGG